jgi:hypothetical protein
VEGDSGTTPVTFTVSLSSACDMPVTVDYTTKDGSAIAGYDYLAASGTLTFAPGERTKTITLEVVGDTDWEYRFIGDYYVRDDTEEFSVTLSNASNKGLLADNQFVVTIYDNDFPDQPPDEGCDFGC